MIGGTVDSRSIDTRERSSDSEQLEKSKASDKADIAKIDFLILDVTSSHFALAEEFYDRESSNGKFKSLADHQCQVMLSNEIPLGMIVYRKALLNCCPYDQLEDTFEIDFLTIFDKSLSSQYGNHLIEKIIELSHQYFAKSIHVCLPIFSLGLAKQLEEKNFVCMEGKPNDKFQFKQKHLVLKVSQYAQSSILRGFGEIKQAQMLPQLFPAIPSSTSSSSSNEDCSDRKRKRPLTHSLTFSEQKGTDSRGETFKIPFPIANRSRLVHEQKKPRMDLLEIKSRMDKGNGEIERESQGKKRGMVKTISSYDLGRDAVVSLVIRTLTLKKVHVHQIRNGQRSVEGRIFTTVSQYRVGNKIRFFYSHKPHDDVTCTITEIKKYNSFKEMLESVGFKKCVPEANSLEDAIAMYHAIPGYQKEAQESGVAAIHLKVDQND